jgi:hypothetical protein
MLKKIMTVSGKPGLFRLVSQGKNMNIVESLTDGRRIPTYQRDKVVSLGDIQVYTSSGEASLRDILTTVKERENGQKLDIRNISQPDQWRNFFQEILPDFDREKVYPSDIKKIASWYNMLIDAGITEFQKEEEAVDSEKQNENEETAALQPAEKLPVQE